MYPVLGHKVRDVRPSFLSSFRSTPEPSLTFCLTFPLFTASVQKESGRESGQLKSHFSPFLLSSRPHGRGQMRSRYRRLSSSGAPS